MSQLCSNKILAKTISWVYMRTDHDNIYKIGRTSQKDPFLRASNCKKSKIICFCGTYDSLNCEKKLKVLFGKKYELIKGTEYFKGNLHKMLSTFYEGVLEFNKSFIQECEDKINCDDSDFESFSEDDSKSMTFEEIKIVEEKNKRIHYNKKYYQKKSNDKYICSCGSIMINRKQIISRHKKTQKHKNK